MADGLDPLNEVAPAQLSDDEISVFNQSILEGDEAYFDSFGGSVGQVMGGATDLETIVALETEEAGLEGSTAASWGGLIIGVVALALTILEALKETEVDTVVLVNNTSNTTFEFNQDWGYLDSGYCQSMPTGSIAPGQAATFIFSSDGLGFAGTKGALGCTDPVTNNTLNVGWYDPHNGSNAVGVAWNTGVSYEEWYEQNYESWLGTGSAGMGGGPNAQARISSLSGPSITTHIIINDPFVT
jgi:hypothetical protein